MHSVKPATLLKMYHLKGKFQGFDLDIKIFLMPLLSGISRANFFQNNYRRLYLNSDNIVIASHQLVKKAMFEKVQLSLLLQLHKRRLCLCIYLFIYLFIYNHIYCWPTMLAVTNKNQRQ